MYNDPKLNEICLQHPGLFINKTYNNEIKISGTLKIECFWYRIILKCPQYPQLTDLEVYVLHDQIYTKFTATAFNLNADSTIVDVLQKLKNVAPPSFIATKISSNPSKPSNNIYADILELTQNATYKIELNADCTHMRCSNFPQYVQHYIELELPTLRILEHSLPDCVQWQELFDKTAHTLNSTLVLFEKYLAELQPFYECFTDIDELCHVLQPILPTTKLNWRLFLFSERVFLKLTIADVFAPLSSMAIQIIGPTQEVEHLRRIFSDGMRNWDAELDIHKNLLRIFDICYFPMPPIPDQLNDAEEQYCNICYCYRLDHGEVPLVSCDNPHCSLVFHAACLKEWFNTLADGKTFLEVSFGACPFCKAKLSTSFAALLEC